MTGGFYLSVKQLRFNLVNRIEKYSSEQTWSEVDCIPVQRISLRSSVCEWVSERYLW